MVKTMVKLEEFSPRTDSDRYFVSFTSVSSWFHSHKKQKEGTGLCSKSTDRPKIKA